MLKVTTTQLKAGFIRRNGVPASDRATLTEYFARHASYLTITRIVEDPVYLAEPFISTVTWVHDPQMRLLPSPAGVIADEVPGQHQRVRAAPSAGDESRALKEFADKFGLPLEATRGGPESAYPEFQHRVRDARPIAMRESRIANEMNRMALFVVRHQHAAERCPAQDPYVGAMLLNHLSRPNVRQHGVEIQGEAVVAGEHTLYLIVEASDENGLRQFMQPFEMAGSLDIYPGLDMRSRGRERWLRGGVADQR